jgi:CDP-diacylglycerol--glycerol-3-phosphate 3-phosphatidyltransferase
MALSLMNNLSDIVKNLPNVISVLRIAGSISLLFCNVNGWAFWVLYALCGASDMVDGWMARKLQVETKLGAVLDSVADIVFVVCCAVRLLPVLEIPVWLWIWAGAIVFIKIVNQVSALVVCKRFCFPHTLANKMTGLLLFLAVPTIFRTLIPVSIVTAVATFSAIQEGHFIRTRLAG